MTFFITSDGPGKGGDLGGLAGADAHCSQAGRCRRIDRQDLAGLSQHPGRQRGERQGPHRQGTVAERQGHGHRASVADLHSANNKLSKENALSEKGAVINGRGDTPNRHDILTGSQADGTAFAAGEDRTCGNWTSSTTGAAMVGHHDRVGLRRLGADAVVERVASLARAGRRLRPDRSARHRRRWSVLLLRGELSAHQRTRRPGEEPGRFFG